jgi:hypothetical protein
MGVSKGTSFMPRLTPQRVDLFNTGWTDRPKGRYGSGKDAGTLV